MLSISIKYLAQTDSSFYPWSLGWRPIVHLAQDRSIKIRMESIFARYGPYHCPYGIPIMGVHNEFRFRQRKQGYLYRRQRRWNLRNAFPFGLLGLQSLQEVQTRLADRKFTSLLWNSNKILWTKADKDDATSGNFPICWSDKPIWNSSRQSCVNSKVYRTEPDYYRFVLWNRAFSSNHCHMID